MARWQELFEMLLNKNLSAGDIARRLDVKPYRLKQLVKSKRLAARLTAVESVASQKAGHKVVAAIVPAVEKLAALTDDEKSETARRACLDVIHKAEQIYNPEQPKQRPRGDYRNTVRPDKEESAMASLAR